MLISNNSGTVPSPRKRHFGTVQPKRLSFFSIFLRIIQEASMYQKV